MSYVKSFRSLEVYRLSREISAKIFRLSMVFPDTEKFSLTDQVRRSSRSVGAQIAEAWGKRRYEKHFISKLTDADSEVLETEHWIEIARECDYLNEQTEEQLLQACISVSRMLNAMIDKSSLFCHQP